MRKTRMAKLTAVFLTLALVLACSAVPVFAEDTTTDPGTTDPVTTDPPAEPVAFTASGTVVTYDLPGVIAQASLGDEEGEDEEDEGDGDEEEPVDGEEPTISTLEEGTDDGTTDDGTTDDGTTDDGTTDDGTTDDGTTDDGTTDDGTTDDGTTDDGTTDDGTTEEPVIEGPSITIANEEGEFTFPVAEGFTIEAPQTETGEYIVNTGDLAEVSGLDGVVDTIVITPMTTGESRSLNAAVPGVVTAISATGIVVEAADGLSYSFSLSEATRVYAGPLDLTIDVIQIGDMVVVKGDGLGGAEWIRFIGESQKAVREQFRDQQRNGNGHGRFGTAGIEENDDERPLGNGRGNGRGNGNGRGSSRGGR